MKQLDVITIVGARPQFVKAAAVSRAVAAHNRDNPAVTIREKIIHTGQHYDPNMSDVFFDQLEIPRPHVNLQVGSGPHGQQTGTMLERIERVLLEQRPDWVLLYGDTNSTLAGALAAAKLHIPIAHVEAGLRSFDRRMPEEINRITTDVLSTLLLCPTDTAVANLAREGISSGVHKVGDVMYDSVLFNTDLARRTSGILRQLGLEPKHFYLCTVHRAENTDDPARLASLLEALGQLGRAVILPMHPRTRATMGARLDKAGGNIRVVEPLAYLDMLTLETNARLILTDSGGVQKEAYWLGVPCVTMRDHTEWVELVEIGCNVLTSGDCGRILQAVETFEKAGCRLPAGGADGLYGDGQSARTIISTIVRSSGN